MSLGCTVCGCSIEEDEWPTCQNPACATRGFIEEVLRSEDATVAGRAHLESIHTIINAHIEESIDEDTKHALTCVACEIEKLPYVSSLQALEERIAFAERARDNAITQRDVVIERSKAKAQTAGRIISELKTLIHEYVNDPPKTGAEVRARMAEILSESGA